MDTKELLVIIAVAGSVLTAGITYYISRRQLISQNRNLIGAELIPKRFEKFTELYEVLSSLIKKLNNIPTKVPRPEITADEFRKLVEYFLEWDSKNSCLMSYEVTHVWATFYHLLNEYYAKTDQDLTAALNNETERKRITDQASNVESCIKSDIGIYDFDAYGINVIYPTYGSKNADNTWRGVLFKYSIKVVNFVPELVTIKRKIIGEKLALKNLVQD